MTTSRTCNAIKHWLWGEFWLIITQKERGWTLPSLWVEYLSVSLSHEGMGMSPLLQTMPGLLIFTKKLLAFLQVFSVFYLVTVMEYKSYTTIHPKSVEQQEKESKIAQSVESQPRGKQFYVGNLTWVRVHWLCFFSLESFQIIWKDHIQEVF